MYADQHEYISKIVDLIFNLIFSCLRIVSVILWKNYVVYLALQIIQTYGANIIVHIICRHKYPYLRKVPLNKGILKKIVSDVKNIICSKLAAYVYTSTDNITISVLISTVAVGFVSNYTIIIGNLKSLCSSVLNPITPIIGRMLNKEDNTFEKETVFRIFSYVRFLIAGAILVPTTVLIDDFITQWVGVEFVLGHVFLYALIIDLYIHIAHGACCDYITGMGLFRIDRNIEVLGAVVNLVFSILLSVRFGVVGVKIGTVIAQIVYWISRSIIVYRECFHKMDGIYKYWYRNIKYIFEFGLCIMCGNYFFLILRQQISIFIVRFILCGIMCEIVFFMVVFLLNIFDENQRILLKGLKATLKRDIEKRQKT